MPGEREPAVGCAALDATAERKPLALKVDGDVVDTRKMEKTIPIILQWDESFDIGSDTLTGVNDDCTWPTPSMAML